jgi:hypothetical protein
MDEPAARARARRRREDGWPMMEVGGGWDGVGERGDGCC